MTKPGPKELQRQALRAKPSVPAKGAPKSQVTLNSVPLYKQDGAPLQAGDIQASSVTVVSPEEIAAVLADPVKAPRAAVHYVKHLKASRARMKRIRQKGKAP